MCKRPGITLACCAVAVLLDWTKCEDKILTYMCSSKTGAKFWRDVIECNPLLGNQTLTALKTCIPMSNHEEAERTRCFVCSKPDQWEKMMNCLNNKLIELQDESNPYLELSPNMIYKACINLLIKEAEISEKENKPFLPEDKRSVASNCGKMSNTSEF